VGHRVLDGGQRLRSPAQVGQAHGEVVQRSREGRAGRRPASPLPAAVVGCELAGEGPFCAVLKNGRLGSNAQGQLQGLSGSTGEASTSSARSSTRRW
jgi:hypothetical protein